MTRRFNTQGHKGGLVEVKRPDVPRIEPGDLAETLGAETHELEGARGASPVDFYAVRADLLRRLRSEGGRPALEGATERKKIPLTDDDWERLLAIVSKLEQEEGVRTTPGQVASAILHRVLGLFDGKTLVGEMRSAGR